MTDPQTMSNEELAAAVDEMFNSPDFDRIKFEVSRRLRGPDYKAEVMVARRLLEWGGDPKTNSLDDRCEYADIRTANEAKEKGNG